MRNFWKLLVHAIIFSGIFLNLAGQVVAQAKSYVYQHLNQEDGLASSIV